MKAQSHTPLHICVTCIHQPSNTPSIKNVVKERVDRRKCLPDINLFTFEKQGKQTCFKGISEIYYFSPLRVSSFICLDFQLFNTSKIHPILNQLRVSFVLKTLKSHLWEEFYIHSKIRHSTVFLHVLPKHAHMISLLHRIPHQSGTLVIHDDLTGTHFLLSPSIYSLWGESFLMSNP